MANDPTFTESFFAEAQVISTYTRAQAIEDGFLVDISDNEVVRQHYQFPIAITTAVWDIVERAISNKRYLNDLSGVLHDILWMSRSHSMRISKSARLFKVIIRGAGRKSLYTFKIVCGPGDSGEPALTILLPNED